MNDFDLAGKYDIPYMEHMGMRWTCTNGLCGDLSCVCVLFFFNLLDPGETMNDFKLKDFQRLFFQDVLQ